MDTVQQATDNRSDEYVGRHRMGRHRAPDEAEDWWRPEWGAQCAYVDPKRGRCRVAFAHPAGPYNSVFPSDLGHIVDGTEPLAADAEGAGQ